MKNESRGFNVVERNGFSNTGNTKHIFTQWEPGFHLLDKRKRSKKQQKERLTVVQGSEKEKLASEKRRWGYHSLGVKANMALSKLEKSEHLLTSYCHF